jgi:hypothetical protein
LRHGFAGEGLMRFGVILSPPKKERRSMLKLNAVKDASEFPAELLWRHKCTICGAQFAGYYSRRQCSDPCRAQSVRDQGKVSQQRIRDERRVLLKPVQVVPREDETLPSAQLFASMPNGGFTKASHVPTGRSARSFAKQYARPREEPPPHALRQIKTSLAWNCGGELNEKVTWPRACARSRCQRFALESK